MRLGVIISGLMWIGIVWACSGCSVKMELGYHGKTGIDDNTITESFRTASVKGVKY